MPTPPQRGQFSSSQDLEAFDYVVHTRSRQYNMPAEGYTVEGYYGALLNSPAYAAAQLQAAIAFRGAGNSTNTYSHADREWVDQVLSHDMGYYGVLTTHTPDAVAVGVRLEAIAALWEGREEDLTDDEKLLTRFIRAYGNGTIDDETWAAMNTRLGARGVVEYVLFIGHLTIVLRLHQALGVLGAPTTREEVDELIRGLRDGSIPVPAPVDAVKVGRPPEGAAS
jgi:hypothetical protein